ncbi:hypothetical protein CP10881SC42_0007 [Chlamydia avium]|uniref:Uncharacterized protein n=1 Tax=Chlamydia avium TaxID=1457141 RepID=A0ABN0MTE8_9CHLA|nr:hypothetical protein CP10743SC13_0911 [Chlamydia psittaci 10_743_SC13]EPP38750.1 hypothetical protein CP10881SC42_0007 [Chlamydia avium]
MLSHFPDSLLSVSKSPPHFEARLLDLTIDLFSLNEDFSDVAMEDI